MIVVCLLPSHRQPAPRPPASPVQPLQLRRAKVLERTIPTGESSTTIDVSALRAGLYFYNAGSQGQPPQAGKVLLKD